MFLQRLRQPSSPWLFHLLVTVIIILTATLMMLLRQGFTALGFSNYYYIVWLVTPVAMALLMAWGPRAFWGILIGSLIGFLPWYPWQLATVGAVDEAVQVSLGIFLMHRLWPKATPPKPSVRFFVLLIVLGVMLPVCLLSIPTVWVFHGQVAASGSNYWDFYFEWCISEITGVLIVLPALLMLIYPQFRKTVERPLELALYIIVCVTMVAVSVFDVFEVSGERIMRMERWMLICTLIFVVIVRNGVGGVIIANLALIAAAISIEVMFSSADVPWVTSQMLFEFDLYTSHFMALALIIAAGFYDHKVLNRMSRDITAKILKVQAAERSRFAADLHDNVSQEFAAALISLRSGFQQLPDARQNESIRLAERGLNRGLEELCHAAAGLRSELLEHKLFGEVVEDYCKTFRQRYGVDVLLADHAGEHAQNLALTKREHLFRIIQEALRNAVRHGKASVITVELLCAARGGGDLIVRIEDDGVGFDTLRKISMADRPHLGLRLMEERAFIIGGTFTITSKPNKGVVVEVKVPFRRGKGRCDVSQQLDLA